MSSYESLGPTSYDDSMSDSPSYEHEQTPASSRAEKISRGAHKLLCSREFVKALIFGQCLSVLLCGTGVFSGLLQEQGVNIPTAQSFLMYCVLCLVFTTKLAFQSGEGNLVSVLKSSRGWKYFLIGLIDVEANFLVVKAYGYTSVTSVQVLDCFSIATVMLLSRIFLRTQYRFLHYCGVGTALLGLAGMVGADVITGKNGDGGGSNVALGDVLVILGAALYGISNVAQEFVVKSYNKSEFLGMLGMFSTLVAGIQVIVLERQELSKVDFTSYKIVLPWLGFVLFLVAIYLCMAYVIQQTSATITNISLLSADFYALIVGIFIFGYSFHVLYLISFVVVILGVAIYNFRPTEQAVSVNNEVELLK
ncbi:solute carrier family 35 member F2 [Aplysia californica]|uniref:Solute carrier family 35 member F2 n=1 Tax=Aplysia californica TaxID=6500 RepID=A0ABM0JWE4_APLCA|nr:solute carrier family 35 member F2 [Aplysia californica]